MLNGRTIGDSKCQMRSFSFVRTAVTTRACWSFAQTSSGLARFEEVWHFDFELPEAVSGWFTMRRASLTRNQQKMLQTNTGTTLTLRSVEQALYLILGQDCKHVHDLHQQRQQLQNQGCWKSRQQVLHAQESDWGDFEEEHAEEAWPLLWGRDWWMGKMKKFFLRPKKMLKKFSMLTMLASMTPKSL